MIFNEDSLREEIVRVWGPAGAHVDVFDMLRARLQQLEAAHTQAEAVIAAARNYRKAQLDQNPSLRFYGSDLDNRIAAWDAHDKEPT